MTRAAYDPFAEPQLDAFYGGFVPTPDDSRDYPYPRLRAPRRLALARTNHDLRQWGATGQSMCMPIANQLQIGACTAWTWAYEARGMMTARWRILNDISANLNDTMAPGFLYDVERSPQYLNTYPRDSGADMRSGGQVLLDFGCPPEADYPYTGQADDGPLATTVTPHVLEAAAFYGISAYFRLQGSGTALIDSILQCLDEGYPVPIAILVGQTFEQCPGSGRVGLMRASEAVIGGHAITVVGNYIDSSFAGGGALVIQNHWGPGWGDVNGDQGGFAYLPFAWATTVHPTYGPWLQEAWTCR
jgi:hypothetical protein